MKALMASIVLISAMASGCTFGEYSLPDGFRVRATGTYMWVPFPFAEGGLYYDFIGIGWLVHDESSDDLCLYYQGKELAFAGDHGSNGWKLTAAGREKIAKNGWSLGGEFGGDKSSILTGCVQQADPFPLAPRSRPKRFTPWMPVLNSDNETDYLYRWEITPEPLRVLGKQADSIVFLLSSNQGYLRIASFDSARYEWNGSSIAPGGEELPGGYIIYFRLRDRQTGKMLNGRYIHQVSWYDTVILGTTQEATPK